VEDSLKRLQTDYIDLYQLHGGMIEDPIEEIIETFEFLQSQGKIRYYGISSIRPNVIREYVKRSNITSVMMQYSLADRRPEEEILKLLLQNNIGVLARGSLAQGILIDKPAKEYLGHNISVIQNAKSIVQTLVKDSRNAAQTVIQFVLANPAVSSAIVGVRSIVQLNEIVCTEESEKLTKSDMEILRNALPAKGYEQHR
jgi:aryl-alcohol dehydrogenase-like predicted oxidoreductase